MDPSKVQWFGEPWNAPVCDPEQEIDVPHREKCARCSCEFQPDAQGLAIPFIDGLLTETMVETEAEATEAGLWPGGLLYFHRSCFMEAIR